MSEEITTPGQLMRNNNGLLPYPDGKHAINLEEKDRAFGWIYYKHPDGQWVTLRKSEQCELNNALMQIGKWII